MRLLKATYDFREYVSWKEFEYCSGKMGYALCDFCIFNWKDDRIVGFFSYDLTHEDVEVLGECFKRYLAEYRDEQNKQTISGNFEK